METKKNKKKANKKSNNLVALFDGYKDDYNPEIIDWGKPKGKEVW